MRQHLGVCSSIRLTFFRDPEREFVIFHSAPFQVVQYNDTA